MEELVTINQKYMLDLKKALIFLIRYLFLGEGVTK